MSTTTQRQQNSIARHGGDEKQTIAASPQIEPPVQHEAVRLKNLLVVIDEDLLHEQHPERSVLLERAIWLARENHAAVTLLHICFDASLAKRWYRTKQQLTQDRLDLVDTVATRLAEFAANLKAHTGLEFAHDVRWEFPEAAAIIQKAVRSGADLILKRSDQSNYLMGLLTNTDWELIRQAPCNIWFATGAPGTGETAAPGHVLAAIGSRQEESRFFDANDYDVCAFAQHLTAGDVTRLSVLHTFDSPTVPVIQGRTEFDPNAAMELARSRSAIQARAREEHQRAVDGLIEYFHLDPDSVEVSEGRPSDAINDAAVRRSVDAIVMGAASMSRLGRLMNRVSAEPVLANAQCDVIIVREHISAEDLPGPLQTPLQGLPAVDVERAIINPDIVFNHSPDLLIREDRLSREMRLRLLDIWENDLRAEMKEADEGGLPAPAHVELIPAIHRARKKLQNGE